MRLFSCFLLVEILGTGCGSPSPAAPTTQERLSSVVRDSPLDVSESRPDAEEPRSADALDGTATAPTPETDEYLVWDRNSTYWIRAGTDGGDVVASREGIGGGVAVAVRGTIVVMGQGEEEGTNWDCDCLARSLAAEGERPSRCATATTIPVPQLIDLLSGDVVFSFGGRPPVGDIHDWKYETEPLGALGPYLFALVRMLGSECAPGLAGMPHILSQKFVVVDVERGESIEAGDVPEDWPDEATVAAELKSRACIVTVTDEPPVTVVDPRFLPDGSFDGVAWRLMPGLKPICGDGVPLDAWRVSRAFPADSLSPVMRPFTELPPLAVAYAARHGSYLSGWSRIDIEPERRGRLLDAFRGPVPRLAD